LTQQVHKGGRGRQLVEQRSRNRLLSGEHNIFPAGGRDRGFNKLPKIFKISWSQ
jgi:hypothetical protein